MIMERPRTRAELAPVALRLHETGWTAVRIADQFGISRSYAASLISDPDGAKERARKDSYRLPCPECGSLMSGSDGITGAPGRCGECQRENPPRVWTPDLVIARIQEWAERFGQPPTANDWGIARADGKRVRPEMAAFYAASTGYYPQVSTIQKLFGSWAAAIEAAGFDRPYSGTRRPRKDTAARTAAPADLERTPRMSTTAHDALATRDCTQAGCANEAAWTRGPYAGLCQEHANERRRAPATRNGSPPRQVSDGLEAKVKELGKLGKQVDRKRARATRLTAEALAAKAEADAAEADFQCRARELMGGAE